jgi:hypothetical protein
MATAGTVKAGHRVELTGVQYNVIGVENSTRLLYAEKRDGTVGRFRLAESAVTDLGWQGESRPAKPGF